MWMTIRFTTTPYQSDNVLFMMDCIFNGPQLKEYTILMTIDFVEICNSTEKVKLVGH